MLGVMMYSLDYTAPYLERTEKDWQLTQLGVKYDDVAHSIASDEQTSGVVAAVTTILLSRVAVNIS